MCKETVVRSVVALGGGGLRSGEAETTKGAQGVGSVGWLLIPFL